VIAIAHRLSTIARMDRLIVLDAGRIVEAGSHAELLQLDGHYAKLWRHQSGGFLAPDVAVLDTAIEPQEDLSRDQPHPEPLVEAGIDDAPLPRLT